MAKRTLFIYRGNRGACSAMTVHRKLHGYTVIRIKKTETGGVVHKPYRYPGIPHRDIIPGAFFVSARDEKEITEFFERFKVPYVRIRPREVKISNWRGEGTSGARLKCLKISRALRAGEGQWGDDKTLKDRLNIVLFKRLDWPTVARQ